MGRQNQTITKMKLFLTFAFITFGAVTASGVPTCDECKTAVGDLVTRLLTDESLAEQISILKLVLCPQLPADLGDCEAGLDMWFPDMASCIYNHFLLEQDVCTLYLGYCTAQKSKVMEWTCDECQGALTYLAEYMAMDETIAEGHTEECPTLVEGILPLAMPILASALMEQSVELCQEVIGVC